MLNNFIEVKDNILPEDVSTGPVVLIFSADWCGPGRMMIPHFNKVAKEYGDKVRFLYIDTDNNNELAAAHGVKSVPLTVFTRDGVKTNVVKGGMDYERILSEVKVIENKKDKANVKSREEELKIIIKNAQEELDIIRKGVSWEEACKLISDGLKNKEDETIAISTLSGELFHGYRGIGMIYDRHVHKNATDRYRIK